MASYRSQADRPAEGGRGEEAEGVGALAAALLGRLQQQARPSVAPLTTPVQRLASGPWGVRSRLDFKVSGFSSALAPECLVSAPGPSGTDLGRRAASDGSPEGAHKWILSLGARRLKGSAGRK
ncbi:unnamed protein product [Prorocentrum cordatum]|uniref:Uncharacterized protein n=1 Tax=Prorocentrum cordatum TaxID=2364126 RepID=A0ABN9V703_9DINO|nr:unnamed protein product [Polarella glacialis]